MNDQTETIERPEDETEDDYALRNRVVAAAVQAAEVSDRARLLAVFEPLHPADIADLLEQVNVEDRTSILQLAGDYIDGEILSEIDEDIRDEVVETLEPKVLAEAVRELESDDVVDILEDLGDEQQEAVLEALDVVDRIAVEQALAYPEFSAGRLMQREIVIAPEHWSVGDAIDHMRAETELPEQFYHVILVDPRHRPVAYVTLGRLMSSRREVLLADITEDSFRTFDAFEDEGDVAYAFNQYHLITAPVVDEDGRLAGVITIDDAMAVLDEEHEEDVLRLGGVGDESLSNSTFEIVKRRFPWLGVNLVTAILASIVISIFEDVLQAVVALAVLMPIVASMGGNAGTQSMT
ncbi:MAG: magnesium transporter, partial [Boseongicola sp.]|nr:magnesium transporter [Boseongicola sp.]